MPLDNSAIGQMLHYSRLNERLFEAAPELPLLTSGIRDPYIVAFSVPVFGEDDKLIVALRLTLADRASIAPYTVHV